MPNLHLVVMAGGSGTRFWPKSTSKRPKQLLSFGADASATLLARTLDRFDGLVPPSQRMIVTTAALAGACRAQVAPEVTILGEPQGRNTAPCVYWAAREVARRDPEAVMLVMPADHYMHAPERFRETVRAAADRAAAHDELVTLGVKPTRPETGYGYLQTGAAVAPGVLRVEKFVEKPDQARAVQFVEGGRHLWNGGMFLWRARVALEAFDRHMPEMRREWEAAGGDALRAYPKLTATSIDYGVMEKASNVVTLPLDCGWDDLGSWTSLESLADVLKARAPAGVVTGGEAIAVESTGNVVDAPGRVVALLGVDDLIVVDSGAALLIARKDRAQDIRLVVEAIKKTKPELA